MTPRQAYDGTAARARSLLRLHDGLINIRKRGIRKDWKRNFCKLMHWPQDSAIQRVDGKDAILILRDGSGLVPADFTKDALDDLLRSALVIGVSALDRYVHERVIKRIIKSLKAKELPQELEEFEVPAFEALRLADALAKAMRSNTRIRPANEVRKRLQDALHRRPFQNWREVEYAMKLIGVPNLAGQLQGAYGVGDFRPIRTQLNSIVARRHAIVHEGDLLRHQRGGKVKKRPIERIYVQQSMDFLDTFVGHLGGV